MSKPIIALPHQPTLATACSCYQPDRSLREHEHACSRLHKPEAQPRDTRTDLAQRNHASAAQRGAECVGPLVRKEMQTQTRNTCSPSCSMCIEPCYAVLCALLLLQAPAAASSHLTSCCQMQHKPVQATQTRAQGRNWSSERNFDAQLRTQQTCSASNTPCTYPGKPNLPQKLAGPSTSTLPQAPPKRSGVLDWWPSPPAHSSHTQNTPDRPQQPTH